MGEGRRYTLKQDFHLNRPVLKYVKPVYSIYCIDTEIKIHYSSCYLFVKCSGAYVNFTSAHTSVSFCPVQKKERQFSQHVLVHCPLDLAVKVYIISVMLSNLLLMPLSIYLCRCEMAILPWPCSTILYYSDTSTNCNQNNKTTYVNTPETTARVSCSHSNEE